MKWTIGIIATFIVGLAIIIGLYPVLPLMTWFMVAIIGAILIATYCASAGVNHAIFPYELWVGHKFKNTIKERAKEGWKITTSGFTAKNKGDGWWYIYAKAERKNDLSQWTNNFFSYNPTTDQIKGNFIGGGVFKNEH